MMVSVYASRLRLTLASVPADRPADRGAELNAALAILGLIALKGKAVTADALHCDRRTVAAINAKGGDWCLALKATRTRSCPMPEPASERCAPVIPWPAVRRPAMAARRSVPLRSSPRRNWRSITMSPS